MWPFRSRPQTTEHELLTAVNDRKRLDDVEDAVEHMGRRFARLQQQVTRWSRDFDEDLDDDVEEDDVLDEIKKLRRGNG